jgi:hypothetical protein
VRSIDVRAPDSLHRHVEALVADASRRRERTPRYRRPLGPGRFAFAGALAAVVVAIAIAIGLSGGGAIRSSARRRPSRWASRDGRAA